MNEVSAANIDFLELNSGEFRLIADLAKRDYGLNIEVSKQALIQSRLRRRLRALSMTDFKTYLALVEGGDPVERDHFIGALTTNVTRFFREPHHFRQLSADIIPDLISRARSGQSVRLWSAGCSTGPEPYSIAATILKLCPDANNLDLRILATDLDPFVIAKAEQGKYETEEAEIADETPSSTLFENHSSGDEELLIRPELRQLVSFARLNLHENWPMRRKFDVIFCRNVVIYFDQVTQAKLWSRFLNQLSPGGHLFIGHSERVHGPSLSDFTSVGLNCYQKSSENPN